ncbi:MAG: hypothetical protein WAO28_04595 [Candidatus Microsaccharimonas sp.]
MKNPNYLPNAPLLPIAEMSVADFYALPVEEQLELAGIINASYRPAVNDLFSSQRPALAWAAIGVPSGEILATGTEAENMPTKIKEVETLAREALTRSVPFVFLPTTFASPGN